MAIKYPGGKSNDSEVYANVEDNWGGTYPVGRNRRWHSGIHVISKFPVYPLCDGVLAAFRLDETHCSISRLKEITSNEYEKLTQKEEKEIYKKQTTVIGENYKLIDDNANEYFSSGFILVRHEGVIPTAGNAPKIAVNFFTLYMNLNPYRNIEPNKNYYEYQSIRSINQQEDIFIPFYQKWIFKVSGANLPSHYYTTFNQNGDGKIFPYSQCLIVEDPLKTQENLVCKFDNMPEKEIRVPSEIIEVITKRYVPGGNGVAIYRRIPLDSDEDDRCRLTTIKESAFFTTINIERGNGRTWDYNTGYVKVSVAGHEINPSHHEGWLYMPGVDFSGSNKENINNQIKVLGDSVPSKRYECIISNQTQTILQIKGTVEKRHCPYIFGKEPIISSTNYKVISIMAFIEELLQLNWLNKFINFITGGIEYDPSVIKITTTPDNKFVKSIEINKTTAKNPQNTARISASSDMRIVIIKEKDLIFDHKSNFSDSAVQYAFFYDKTPVTPAVIENGNSAASFAKCTHLPTNSFECFVVTRMDILAENDCVEIIKDLPLTDPYFIKNMENMVFCRWFLPEKQLHSVLIKASDLEYTGTGRGRVKPGFTGQSRLDGFMIYDIDEQEGKQTNTQPIGNARRVIEKDGEFELLHAEKFLSSRTQGLYPLKTENDGMIRYIHIKNIEAVQAKIVFKQEFGQFGKTIKGEDLPRIGTDTVLGFPSPEKESAMHDLVVFFTDDSFMNKTESRIDLYRIKKEKDIYSISGKTQNTHYFPPHTVLSFETFTEGRKKVYKLTVKSMEIFFRINDNYVENNKLEAGKNYKIQMAPMKIWLFDQLIDFSNDSEIACEAKVDIFAKSFNKIRGKIKDMELLCKENRAQSADNKIPRFYIEFSENQNLQLDYALWVFADDMEKLVNKTIDESAKTITLEGGVEITGYDDNPLYSAFTKKDRTGIYGQDLMLKSVINEEYEKKGTAVSVYQGFSLKDGEIFYVLKDDVENENALEWEKYFTKMGDDPNDLYYDPGDYDEMIKRSREEKRKIVCRHPLEWDKTQYTAEKLQAHSPFMNKERLDRIGKKSEILDIWNDIKDIEGIKQNENKLWFAHPVYFISHLDKMDFISSTVRNLLEAQKIVLDYLPYRKGGGGPPHLLLPPGSKTTYCSTSTFDVLEATGFHTEGLYNTKDITAHQIDTTANQASEHLVKMAEGGKIIKIKAEEAQKLANIGYTVVAAWYNSDGHGHLSTVRPWYDDDYDDSRGPFLANVGWQTGKMFAFTTDAFGKDKDVKFYYDPNQSFIFDTTKMWCKKAPLR
jgi:hypothetical protein